MNSPYPPFIFNSPFHVCSCHVKDDDRLSNHGFWVVFKMNGRRDWTPHIYSEVTSSHFNPIELLVYMWFPKMGVPPKSSILMLFFPYKPSILGYPQFRNLYFCWWNLYDILYAIVVSPGPPGGSVVQAAG